MTFQYLQAFVNGFLTCSDIDETIYQENREIEKTIDFQQKVIKNAQIELEKLLSNKG